MKTPTFVDLINAYGATVPKNAPPIAVFHPHYGFIGTVATRGFVPPRARWTSTQAILRDADRNTVRLLQRFDRYAPTFVKAAAWSALSALSHQPLALPTLIGAIASYDNIVTARGSGALQDVWMAMTASKTPVTTSWYDMMSFASWVPMTAPTIAAYTNAGTGGAVLNATSNGSWLVNPGGTNKKYIVSMGLTTTSVSGFSVAMLYDCLWAGQYVLTSNVTINPTTDVAVTRYASTTPGDADYSGGNMMMCSLASTLTHTAAPTVTTTYTNQAGTAGKTTISVGPATGPLINRVIFNTIHNAATVLGNTPFMPLTNGGDSGVTKLEQVVISGGTVSAGTVNHKIVRPLAMMPFIAANSYIEQDTTLNIGNMVELHNVTQVCGCLGWLNFSAGTGAVTYSAFVRMVEG